MGRKKVSKEQRDEIFRRVQAGEKRGVIALDYGITRQGLDYIVEDYLNPEKARLRSESRFKKRLIESEIKKLKEIFATTEPKDHGFTKDPHRWDMEYGNQLVQKLFGKKPAAAVLKSLIAPYARRISSREIGDPKPQPPEPFDIKNMDPEMAKDKDFVRYCKSPIAKQIAWRSYECALREWEERNEIRTAREMINDKKPFVQPVVGKRVGKHAGSRGSHFTKKKKRRR